jgi:hypothetical protein
MATVGRLNIFLNADPSGLEKALARVGKKLDRVGKEFTTKVSAPLAAMGAALGVATVKAAEFADTIDKTAIRTGLSRTALQQLQYATDQAGVSFDAIEASILGFSRNLPELEKGTGRASDALRRLGVSAKDEAGQLRPMSEMFPEMIRGLSGVQNETERNALGFQLFGKRMGELMPLVAMGGEELDRLMNRANELGIVMSDDSISSFVVFKDGLSEVKQQLAAASASIAQAFLPIMMSGVSFIQTKVVPVLQQFAAWLNRLDQGTKEMALMVGALVAAIGPLVLAMGFVLKMAIVLSSPLAVIAAIIATLGFIALTVARNWDVLRIYGAQAWAAIKGAVFKAVDGILGMLEKLAGWVPGLSDRIRNLRGEFNRFADQSLAKSEARIEALYTAINDNFSPAVDRAARTVGGMADVELPDLQAATASVTVEVDKVAEAMDRHAHRMGVVAIMSEALGEEYDALRNEASTLHSTMEALAGEGIGATDARMVEFAARLAEIRELMREVAETTEVETTPRISELQATIQRMGQRGTDAFADFAMGSKAAIGDFVKAALRDLARLMARMLALKALQAALPGGLAIGGMQVLAGARAGGGPVAAGRTYLVGERGPELFTPRGAGEIVANHNMGGGGAAAITLNVGPARDPISLARDGQWMRAFDEMQRAHRANGGR